MHYFLAVFILFSLSYTHAQIYRCGAKCYTDNPQFSQHPITLSDFQPSYSEPKIKKTATPSDTNTHSHKPTQQPNRTTKTNSVPHSSSNNTPRASHSPSRREILRGELLNEHQALTHAQQRLNEIKKKNPSSDEMGRLKTEITERQHNIQALQKELNQR